MLRPPAHVPAVSVFVPSIIPSCLNVVVKELARYAGGDEDASTFTKYMDILTWMDKRYYACYRVMSSLGPVIVHPTSTRSIVAVLSGFATDVESVIAEHLSLTLKVTDFLTRMNNQASVKKFIINIVKTQLVTVVVPFELDFIQALARLMEPVRKRDVSELDARLDVMYMAWREQSLISQPIPHQEDDDINRETVLNEKIAETTSVLSALHDDDDEPLFAAPLLGALAHVTSLVKFINSLV